MINRTERAVAARVPSLAEEKLTVLGLREPLTVPPGTPLSECVRLIQQSGRGDSVLVCDDGRLLGVLTERDIFGRIVGSDLDLSQPVDQLMNTKPHRLSLQSTVRDAIELMETGLYRNIPLVDGEAKVVGIIRPQDVLSYLAEAFPEELLNLPPRPHQLMEEPDGA